MIQAAHPLTVTRRCELLDVARSTVYYHPTGIPSEDLALMRLLDEIHLERPFYGSRRLRDELETQGHPVNRKRVQRLVRQMGLRALYPKPRTSQPGVGHTVYPYLLRGLSIERPNQVWCSAPGFLDSGLTVFASTLPRPARRGHVAPERDFDSGISPASTARCTFA